MNDNAQRKYYECTGIEHAILGSIIPWVYSRSVKTEMITIDHGRMTFLRIVPIIGPKTNAELVVAP